MNGDGGALQISNLGYGLFAEFGQDADPNFAGVFVGDVANPLRTRTNYSIISSPDDLANDTWVNVETGGSDGFRIHDNGRFVCNNFGCFMSSAAGSAIGYTDLVGLDINGLMAFSEAGKDAGYIGVLSNSDTMTAGSWAFGGGPTGTFCFWDPTLVNIESATNFSLCMFGDAGVTALNAASEIRAKIAGTTVIDVKPGNTTINGNLDIDGGCLTLGGVIYCSLQDAGFGGGGGFPSDGGACLTMASGEVRCPLSPGGVVETPVDGGVFELNGIERFTGNGPTEQADPLGAGGELFTAVDAGPAPPSGQQQMYYCFNIPGASGPLCIGDQGGSGNSPAIWFGLNAMGIDAGNLTPAPTFMNPGIYGNALANFLYVNVLHGGTFAVRQDDVGILTCTQNDGTAATNYSTCTLGSTYSQLQDGGAIGGRLFLDGLGGSWIVGSQTGQVRIGADAGFTFNLGGGPFESPEGTPILNLISGLATINGTVVGQNIVADGGKIALDTSETTFAQKSNGYYGITQNSDTITIGSTAFGAGPTNDMCFYDPSIVSQSASNYSLCFLGAGGISLLNGATEIRNQIAGSTILDVNGANMISYVPLFVGFGSSEYMELQGGASGSGVEFSSAGTDTNIPIRFVPKGSGFVGGPAFCSNQDAGCYTPGIASTSDTTMDAPTGQCVDVTIGGVVTGQSCTATAGSGPSLEVNTPGSWIQWFIGAKPVMALEPNTANDGGLLFLVGDQVGGSPGQQNGVAIVTGDAGVSPKILASCNDTDCNLGLSGQGAGKVTVADSLAVTGAITATTNITASGSTSQVGCTTALGKIILDSTPNDFIQEDGSGNLRLASNGTSASTYLNYVSSGNTLFTQAAANGSDAQLGVTATSDANPNIAISAVNTGVIKLNSSTKLATSKSLTFGTGTGITNFTAGQCTLSTGTCTVSDSTIAATSVIVANVVGSGTIGSPCEISYSAGVSFTLTCTGTTDTTANWVRFN
jgi:hypothetical protein